MIWHMIDFICRETALHLRRERLIAIATISTVAVLLLLLGAIVLFLLNLHVWSDRLAQQLELRAYFERDYPRAKAQEAARRIASWPEVHSSRFVTKEEGWEWLRKNVVSGGELRGLDNPLPDRVDVRAKSPELAPQLARKLEGLSGVKDVVPSAAAAGRKGGFVYSLVRAKHAVTWTAIFASLLAAVAGLFIVHNTVRLIAAPFLLEGLLHGVIGAALACCLLLPAHMYLRSFTAHTVPFLRLAPNEALLPFALGLIAAGALLGLTGSIFSVRRYLARKPGWHG